MQRSIHDPLDSQRYAYDSASRLVATSRGQYPEGDFITSPSLYCESPTTATWTTEESAFQWGLDGAGNWDQYDTWKNSVETNQTRTDTNFNEIHQVAATTLTHNDHGDMTYDGTHQYKWDAFGRLREVRSAGGTLQATYYYDADHRRVRKDFVSGTDLDFLYDGWRAIEIRKTATQLPYFQSIIGNYLDEQLEADYNGGTPDATCTGAGDAAYGIQNNALFSVYAVTRPDKSINSAFEYDPYGYPTRLIDGNDGDTTVNFNSNDTRAAGIGSTFLHSYTGQTFDPESGLYYYKRRYYHPTLGRFSSRDPIGYADGAHLYQYVRGNPTLSSDPMGLQATPPPRAPVPPWARPWACAACLCGLAGGQAAGCAWGCRGASDYGGCVADCLWGALDSATAQNSLAICGAICLIPWDLIIGGPGGGGDDDGGYNPEDPNPPREIPVVPPEGLPYGDQTPPGCEGRPCTPVAGTIEYRIDYTGRDHGGVGLPHTHVFRMNQGPPSRECLCRWSEVMVVPGVL
jgi:RHS repeat-associated protein